MSLFRHIPPRTLTIACGLVLAVYWIGLFVVTHLPPEILFDRFGSADEYLADGGDKMIHLLAYAGLAFLFTTWLRLRGTEDPRLWRISAAVVCGYAVVDELLQIPFRRTASAGDCLADWAGVAIGLFCFLAVRLLADRSGFRHKPASLEAR